MPNTVITALISIGGTLLVSIITQVSNAYIERFRRKLKMQQKENQIKRKHLNEVYIELSSILNLYPYLSPNDILGYIDSVPTYSMEKFDSTLRILDCQVEDYKKRLNDININYELKNDIDIQISNREYAKEKISEIRDKYYIARGRYKAFCESDKAVFDLYAGQDVRNRLVEFEVIIHNVFKSGCVTKSYDTPKKNVIQVSRRKLIDSMRKDIGIY